MSRRFSFSLIFTALAAGAVPAGAQQPRATPSGLGTVQGVVYDSLLGRPLAGARLFARGTRRQAVTDAGGRFRIDSLRAGRILLDLEHDELDSIGLSNLVRPVEVAAGRITVVEIGVPSHLTVRRGICRGRSPFGAADSAVVFGSVRDAEGGQRLANAAVRVGWVAVQRQGPEGPIDILRPFLDVRTDSIGNYYACGVPGGIIITARAFADSGSTGVTELLVGPRGVARHDLRVSRERVPGSAPDSVGLRRGLATLIAVVRTEDRLPRPSARVSVDDTPVERLTDENGRVVLDNLPSGSQMMMVRMIGYSAVRRMVNLRNRDTLRIELTVREVTVLDTLRVIGTSRVATGYLEELEQRLRTGGGATSWQALTGEQLRRMQTTRSVFQQFQGLRVEGRTAYNFRLYSGADCLVNLFIDGQRADVEQIQSYRPEQLIAVEYFPRGSQAPAWASTTLSPCGVALVWTRFLR